MLRVFKWHKRTQEILVWKSASRHGDRVLLRHVVRNWRVSVVKKLADSSDLVGRAERFFELTLMRTHLRAWGRFRSPSRAEEELKGVRAYEWWCERSRAALFRQWRDNIRKNITRRLKMVEMLLFILPIEFQNSSRQKPKVECAVTFHRRRALRKAWTAFLGLKTELMELQQRFKVCTYAYVLQNCVQNVYLLPLSQFHRRFCVNRKHPWVLLKVIPLSRTSYYIFTRHPKDLSGNTFDDVVCF